MGQREGAYLLGHIVQRFLLPRKVQEVFWQIQQLSWDLKDGKMRHSQVALSSICRRGYWGSDRSDDSHQWYGKYMPAWGLNLESTSEPFIGTLVDNIRPQGRCGSSQEKEVWHNTWLPHLAGTRAGGQRAAAHGASWGQAFRKQRPAGNLFVPWSYLREQWVPTV